MRAAVIEAIGEPPVVREVREPEPEPGEVVVEVEAAAINPIDVSIATGRFYGGSPATPYVMGREAVGRTQDGRRIWFQPPRGGGFAERAVASEQQAIELPDATDRAKAAALGIAGLTGWLAVAWRAQVRGGERVLVLGATGVVGLVAVQAARSLGAARIVAAGRDAAALETARAAGADRCVRLPAEFDEEFDVVVDPLWGEPARAAIEAAAEDARVVQLGQSAGAEVTLRSGAIRGRSLNLLGFTLGHAPRDVQAAAYARLLAEVDVDVETLPLESAADAWRRQQESPHGKLVLVP